MIPVLFAKNATNFTTNGIGRLECVSCVVTEERNGIYELEAVLPIGGNHVSEVEMDSIIAVIPHDGGTMQGFRVYQMTKPISGKFAVYARHISYQLLDIPTMPFSIAASASACASTLAGLKSHAVESCPFTFWTNVTTAGTYSQSVPSAIRQRLLGVEGSVLDQFGGEYEWDNYAVKLHNKRGRPVETTGITLRYGKNITDLEQEEEITNVVTGVVPYWADTEGNTVTLTEKAVYSQYRDNYPFRRTVPLDLSDKWEEAPTEAELRTAAQAFVNNSDLGVPKVSIEVSFVALWQSEEYKDVLPLQRVQLCDEINVVFEEYNISQTAKVVKTVYNVLKDRYDSIQVGSLRSSFASAITDMNAQTLSEIEAQSVATSQAINNATKWLTSAGGYVIAIKNTDGTWKELVFSNMTDPYNSNAKILRINNNGIGFSLNGMNGTFRNAWTIDGNLVADFIHGGTLTLGGNGNGNGWLKIVDSSGNTIGIWNNAGITIKAGSINLNGNFIVDTSGNVTIKAGSINLNDKFKVSSAGALTATSGAVGGFTIDDNSVRSGSLTATSAGAVALTNADFARSIGGTGRSALRLAIGSQFGVDKNGNLYANNAVIKGTLKFNQSLTIDGRDYIDAEEAIAAVDRWVSNFAEAQEETNEAIDKRLKALGG